MTVSVSNTNINDSFNAWRLNTNFVATVISNNAVTVSRAGSANRGGVAKGNGHIAGTFTANELRTTVLKSGNTSSEGGWIQIASNTSINATSLTVTANTSFQGNVNFITSGTDRIVLGDISRVRVTGGTRGQFLRIEGSTDTPNFKSLSLRDITDLSSNSADIILSGANSVFSDNGDSPKLRLTNGSDTASIYLASAGAGESDIHVKLVDAAGSSTFAITDNSNNIVGYIDSSGNIVAATAFLPSADDAVDLGSSGAEFRNLYIDGVANIDELSMGTAAGQGVATSLIPKTDAVGNLGSTTRKWGTVWADTTNGGAGIFNTVGVSSTLTVNGTATFNGGFNLTGDVDIGDASTDTLTITAQVDSNFDPETGSQRNMGSTNNRWHNVYANNVLANNVTTDNNLTVLGDLTVSGTTTISSGQAFSADDGTFTTLNVTGQTNLDGDVNLGNATTDSITVTGQFDSALIPITDDTYDLGTATKQWQDIWIDGTASIDVLSVDETSTFTGNATFNGDRVTVSGNGFFSDSIDVADSIDVTNSITNDGTVMLGKNGKLHANNTISNQTITTAMLTTTGTSTGLFGNSSVIPSFIVGADGRITGVSNNAVAGVEGLTYTQSNNNIRISTATGITYDDAIEPATTTSSTGRGVASFDSGDFDVTSGHVVLKNASTGAVLAINGTANEVNVSRTNGTVTVGLPDDVTVTGQLNVGENIVISGNLIVNGTTTTINSTTVRVEDNIIVLNEGVTGAPSLDAGISIERGTSADKTLLWNETTDKWTVGSETFVAGTFEGDLTGNVTGDVTGNASTATALQNTRTIAGKNFNGTQNVTLDTLTRGSYLTGSNYNGSSATTWAVDATTTNTASKVVARDASGNFSAGTITATLAGNSSTATKLATSRTISATGDISWSVSFDGSGNATGTATIQPNSVALGTDTSGNYVATITAGSGLTSTGATTGESIAHSLSVDADQRGVIDQIGLDTNDYYNIDATQHRWFLDGAEDMRLTNDGQLDVEGSVVAHSATVSDINLKENIVQVTDAISKVQQLNGYTFNYKKDGRSGAGIIAQEVEKVLPSAVRKTEILGHDGEYLIVEYDQLTALLIESIKELKAEIDELKNNK
jgi:hypothetical protein